MAQPDHVPEWITGVNINLQTEDDGAPQPWKVNLFPNQYLAKEADRVRELLEARIAKSESPREEPANRPTAQQAVQKKVPPRIAQEARLAQSAEHGAPIEAVPKQMPPQVPAAAPPAASSGLAGRPPAAMWKPRP